MSEDRFGQLEQKIDSLGKDLRHEMRGLHADLGHQMRVLHEDTIDRIKALAPDLAPIRRAIHSRAMQRCARTSTVG